jgi:hypothetical protein
LKAKQKGLLLESRAFKPLRCSGRPLFFSASSFGFFSFLFFFPSLLAVRGGVRDLDLRGFLDGVLDLDLLILFAPCP